MRSLLMAVAMLSALASCAPAPEDASDELTGRPIPAAEQNERGNQAEDPYQGTREQVRGFYSRGRLVSADLLPPDGFGFVKIHRPRNRGFGSFDLVQVLRETARQMQELFPSIDRVQIGDMSAEHGGFISGHASHQNGLDADVAFLRLNRTEQDPESTSGFHESFVHNGFLTPNFDLARNWAYAKLLVATGRVQRVFVNEVVKRGLCAYVAAQGGLETERETLRRLRVIRGHTDHFHVRVTCPAQSPDCAPQEEVPADPGC